MYEKRTGKALEVHREPSYSVSQTTTELTAGADVTAVLEFPGIVDCVMGDVLFARRWGEALYLTFLFPPRSKKNHTTLGIRQAPAYRMYRDAIKRVMQPALVQLGLPLAPKPTTYNIKAIYYVDRWGERADKCGLDQGLYDALQGAGVVVDDWQFRTDDGTRIVIGDPRPRVEVMITPIGA